MRKPISKILTSALLLILVLLMSACARINEEIERVTATSTPRATAEPTAEPSPTPGQRVMNPVFELFSDFFEAFASASRGAVEAAYDGVIPMDSYLSLLKDEAELSKLYLTVGMLIYDDENEAFTGSYTGTYAGSGRLSRLGAFSYELETGLVYSGTVTAEGSLSAVVTDGEAETGLLLNRTADGFMFWVIGPEVTGVCEITGTTLRYESFLNSYGVSRRDVLPRLSGVRILEYTGE